MISLNFTTTGSKTLPPKAKEAEVQKACWSWLGLIDVDGQRVRGISSVQDYSFMVPNGTQLGGSHKGRAKYMASLKAQGFRSGVSDIVIAYPTLCVDFGTDVTGHHGAYIELKRDRESYGGPAAIASAIRPEQVEWLKRMQLVGYYVDIPFGLKEFQATVLNYLSGVTQVDAPKFLL